MPSNLDRLDGESELAYIWRLGQLKDNEVIDMTWPALAEVLNRNLREEDDYLTESAFRKKYSIMKQAKAEVFDGLTSSNELDEIRSERYELYKERVKLSDERRQLNASLRSKAREESFIDQVREIFSGFKYEPIETRSKWLMTDNLDDGTTLLIPAYDIHYGLKVDNSWNKYNPVICRERFVKYVNRIRAIQEKHKAKKAVVVISEAISGAIHSTLRFETNENVIQ